MLRTKSVVAAVCCVCAIAAAGAGSAFGGETTGPWPNGTPLWVDTATHALHGASLCAYSGLNVLGEDESTARTQSWGQIPKAGRDFLTSVGSNPGIACNPTSGFSEGP
jgi:hypothetical protein